MLISTSKLKITETESDYNVIKDTLVEEFPCFLRMRKETRKMLIESNKKLNEFYESEFSLSENVEKQKRIIKNAKRSESLIVEDDMMENSSSPMEEFSDYTDLISHITLEKQTHVPYGVFVYPCENNYRTEETFEIKYMEKIDKFEKFQEVMDSVSTYLNDWFYCYPKNKEEDEKLENDTFIVWAWIKSILKLSSISKIKDRINIILQKFSDLISKKFSVIYKLISGYWIKQLKYFKISRNKNKPSTISKYRELYCQICFEYMCKVHFYTSYEFSSGKQLKTFKKKLRTTSGHPGVRFKTKFTETPKESYYTCKNIADCKLNFNNEKAIKEFSSKPESEILDADYFHSVFSEIKSKNDFYLLNCILSSEIFTNSCYINQFIFKNKYKCSILDRIIQTCKDEDYSYIVDDYLKGGNNLNNKFSNMNIYPSISTEKIKSFKVTDIPASKKSSKTTKNDHDYSPCSHIGQCNKDNCNCIRYRGYCEKFCSCKEICEFQYKGCDCKDGCVRQVCKCRNELRECDPDTCSCKGSNTYFKDSQEYQTLSHKYSLCRNMAINFNWKKKTTLSRSVLCDSLGLFALEDIQENDLICEYTGEILMKEETDKRTIFNEQLGLNYLFGITDCLDIDAYRIGNEMRYVNHSSFGYENCYARKRYVRGVPHIGLYAEKHINKGEELFFDYLMKVNVPWLIRYNKYYGNN